MERLTVSTHSLSVKDSLLGLHTSGSCLILSSPRCQAAELTVFVQLWACIKELKDNQWKLISVASYSDSFEAQLAACKPLELQPLTVPLQPPGIAADLPLPQVGKERMLCCIRELYTQGVLALHMVLLLLCLTPHACFQSGQY